MALFKRADLEAKGLNKEQIEYIMTESGRSLGANYVLSSDVQARIDEAVKAVKPDPVDVKTTPEYAEILRERVALTALLLRQTLQERRYTQFLPIHGRR